MPHVCPRLRRLQKLLPRHLPPTACSLHSSACADCAQIHIAGITQFTVKSRRSQQTRLANNCLT